MYINVPLILSNAVCCYLNNVSSYIKWLYILLNCIASITRNVHNITIYIHVKGYLNSWVQQKESFAKVAMSYIINHICQSDI